MRAFFVLAALLLAGCAETAEPDAEPAPMEPVATADLAKPTPEPRALVLAPRSSAQIGDGIRLDALGDGWGRFEFQVGSDGQFPVVVEHDSMENLHRFSNDGDATYDDGTNHTIVLLMPASNDDITFYWEWWGAPGWAIWPSGSDFDGVYKSTVALRANTTYALILATTVPGFSVTIGEPAGIDWKLADHDDWHVDWPEPTEAAVVREGPAEALWRRDWTVDHPDQPPSLLMRASYSSGEDGEVHVGIESDEAGWGSPTGTVTPFPHYAVAPTSSGYSAGTSLGLWSGGDLHGFRSLERTGASIIPETVMAGFLVIPLE